MKKEKIKNEYSSEEIDTTRYKNFMFLLYPEWENYGDIIIDLRSSFRYYAFITHQPDNEEKKVHTHVVLHLDDGRELSSMSKRLGVPLNLFKPVKSVRGSLRYLTHIDFPEKIQYDIRDVTVSKAYMSNFLKAYDDIESEEDILNNIYSFVDNHVCDNPIQTEIELTKFIVTQNYNSIFKRYYNTIVKYIDYSSYRKEKTGLHNIYKEK